MGFADDTIEAYAGLIKKPTLKEKLLLKPPFRFLHDIITNLQKETNFPPPDAFDPDQLQSANVKEKDQKIAFLNKVIAITEAANGESVDVRPLKIVAGLEPENTNGLLLAIAKAAKNVDNLDIPAIVAQVNGGGEAAAPAADADADADADAGKAKAEAAAAAAAAAEEEEKRRKKEAAAKKKKEKEEAEAAEAAAAAEKRESKSSARGSARGSTGGGSARGGAKGLGGFPVTRNTIEFPEAPEGEDFVACTIRTLGACIQRPKLAPKLLNKPPFRFIHDIVTNCMKSTGFPEGLYAGQELDSKAITETKDKLKFLKKLIDFVAAATGDASIVKTVNPKKIAAGLEPENTNTLLQGLAKAAASGIDTQAVLDKLSAGDSAPAAPPAASPPTSSRKSPEPAKETAKPTPARASPEPQNEAPTSKGPVKAAPMAMPKLALNNLDKEKEEEQNIYAANGVGDASAGVGDEPVQRLSRPKTARRAPPKLKSNLITKDDKKEEAGAGVAGGVILDGEEPEEEDDVEEEEEQEQLQGFDDPVPAEGEHGLLVNNILKAQGKGKEEEKEDKEKGKFGFARLPSARKTQNNSLYNAKNIQELRMKIQKICQSANPLGKIIDFVYEDMDIMNKELEKWRKSYQQYLTQFEDEKNITTNQLEPLTRELEDVTTQVEEQTKKVHAMKAKILTNDRTIWTLLEAHSAGEN